MYPGEALMPNQHATIRGDTDSEGKIGILKVDDKRTISYLRQDGASEVYVLPGKHRITVTLHYAFTHALGELWLVAEPGGRYVVKEISKGLRAKAWIEDEETGKPVGGVAGSDDEPK